MIRHSFLILAACTALIAVASCGNDETETASTVTDTAKPADVVADVMEPEDTAPPPDEGPPPEDLGPPDIITKDIPPVEDVPPTPDVPEEDTPAVLVGDMCFSDIFDPEEPGPEYDKYAPTVGSHCFGTNHQDIVGVEKVVFLGDSVTVGTPNAEHLLSVDNEHFWRSKLATFLADHFGLEKGDDWNFGVWKTYDYFTGKGGQVEAGDFRNCSKWGARTDDFLEGGNQIAECFPEGGSDKVTLVVFTMGGNDISSMTKKGQDATPEEIEAGYPQAWAVAEKTILHLENAVKHIKDPANFPNGAFVVFANPFEFTDGTGDVNACTPQSKLDIPGIGEVDLSTLNVNMAELAGYKAWEDPTTQAAIVIWLLEEYMRIAVEYDADLVWMLEHFCGHGYIATGPDADTENRCYRGPDAELYFDLTCTHPSEAGHAAIYELFKGVVLE